MGLDQQTIKRVAEWCGWETEIDPRGRLLISGVFKFPIPAEQIRVSPVQFAAYAKAATRNRNKYKLHEREDGNAPGNYLILEICDLETGRSVQKIFNPTNPISEAEAIIICIDEVAKGDLKVLV